jgi:DNA helicase-2/ATP-dependent DNA helicase PcrA
MAVAAAIVVARHQLHPRHQLVVVTFTRSAAANLKTKIRGYLQQLGLPLGGFAVQTLHGLAWLIARANPDHASIDPDAVLITPNQSHRLLRRSVEQWILENPMLYQRLIEGQQFDGEETEHLRRQSVLRTEVLPTLARTVIHEAKSSGLSPADLLTKSQRIADEYQTLVIAAGLYEQYQSQLYAKNAIDYDEMILGALRALDAPAIRRHWQERVFAVFEDEAQDSSPLQTRLLEILASSDAAADSSTSPEQHLVRVGDPNQAINSTFTPADPIFFREFCAACRADQRLAEMTQAGRSSPIILEAANFVVTWINQVWQANRNQEPTAQGARTLLAQLATLPDPPFQQQLIQPVPPGDPQPQANPAPEGQGLEIHRPADPYETVERIGQRAIALFEAHPTAQAAVLVRTNDQSRFVVQELSRWHGEVLNILDVTARDRQSQISAEMLALLQFLDRPHSPDYLKAAFTVLMQRQLIPHQDLHALLVLPEQLLYPGPLDPPLTEGARLASRYCTSLLRARLELPSYQLIPFLAYTLDYDQSELATADKLSDRLNQQGLQGALPDLINQLSDIVSSEQFTPVEAEESEDKYSRPGQLTVITMHKAKGLDWDYVFVPFLHETMIPGSLYVPPSAQFLGNVTLAEVARAQIRASVHRQPLPDVATAWERASALKMAEEFRLLYVAMTRAKRLLWLSAAQKAPFSWSKPDNLENRLPCPVIPALMQQFPAAVVQEPETIA